MRRIHPRGPCHVSAKARQLCGRRPWLEAWEELGNDRDRRDSSKALRRRLSQLTMLNKTPCARASALADCGRSASRSMNPSARSALRDVSATAALDRPQPRLLPARGLLLRLGLPRLARLGWRRILLRPLRDTGSLLAWLAVLQCLRVRTRLGRPRRRRTRHERRLEDLPQVGLVVAVLANMNPPAAQRISEYLDLRLPSEG